MNNFHAAEVFSLFKSRYVYLLYKGLMTTYAHGHKIFPNKTADEDLGLIAGYKGLQRTQR